MLHRPCQFVILGLTLIACLQACSSIDHGSPDDPKTGYIYGTVVGITDGDTLKLLTENKKTVKIRLAEIDTPATPTAIRKAGEAGIIGPDFQKAGRHSIGQY